MREWTRLRERDVVHQCLDLLRAYGWKVINYPSGLLERPGGKARVRVGETGGSDKVCLRPMAGQLGLCEVFFLELKAPGKRQSPQQQSWESQMKGYGYMYVAVDSAVKLEEFLGKYFPQS